MPGDLCHVALQRIRTREIALDRYRQGRFGRGTFVAGIERDRLRLQDLGLERLLLLPLLFLLPGPGRLAHLRRRLRPSWGAGLRRFSWLPCFALLTHLYSRKVRCYTG
jgi:hypothetical protein